MTFRKIHSATPPLHAECQTASKNKPHEQSTKAVHFSTTSECCDTISRDDYTVAEVEACWWTAKETKSRQRVLMKKLEKAVATPNHCISQVIGAMQDSVHSLDSQVIGDDNDENTAVSHFVRWTSHCKSLRGLERYVATLAADTHGDWSSYHRSHVAEDIRDHILYMQDDSLSSSSSNTMDEDIALVYESLSKPASLYAILMACGDAQQVLP
jgi:hypothetical protein